LNGWIILDKPTDITSAKALYKFKKFLPRKHKLGHGGTLDPFASGVLPIAIGEATKLIPYAMDGVKIYEFTVCWGKQTDTGDLEGNFTHTSTHLPTQQNIQQILPFFIGEIEQVPPVYSAIKIDGMRACDRVRAGEKVTIKPRRVIIYDLKLIEILDSHHATFEVRCGKGTYVRTLAQDIALKLKTYAYIKVLRRTKVGPFLIQDAKSLDYLLEKATHSALKECISSVERVLDDIPAILITEEEAVKLKRGMGVSPKALSEFQQEGAMVACMHGEKLIAMACVKNNQLLPKRVFNL
jgi:tRNA pseudouridine55 synthase